MDRAALEELSTDELRQKAFHLAERRLDVGFFWDLVKHLPAAGEVARDDSFSSAAAGVSDLIELFREFGGHNLGDSEPMIRAKFVEYVLEHSS
jgi:hypothetical protein